MTRNQIELLKLQESRRLSTEQARIQEQQNKRDIAYRYATLAEAERAARASLDEQVRHNIVGEGQQYQALTEQARRNVASEALTAAAQSETSRANLAREAEQKRANIAQEAIRSAELDESKRQHDLSYEVGKYQAGAAYRNVDLGFANLAEAQRAHQAQESLTAVQLAETATHNRNVEAEQYRKNVAEENLRTSELQLTKDRNLETARHNQQLETLQAVNTGVDAVTSVVNSAANVVRVALR